MASLAVDDPIVNEQTRSLTVPVSGGADVLREALNRLAGTAITVVDVGLRRPDLDDVFMTLTGHAAEQVAEVGDEDGDRAAGGDGAKSPSKKAKATSTETVS